jgi:hypothetical protein
VPINDKEKTTTSTALADKGNLQKKKEKKKRVSGRLFPHPGYLCDITSNHFIVLCDQIIAEDLLFLQRMTNHSIATAKISHHGTFGHFGELFKDEIHRIHRPGFDLMSKPFVILQEQRLDTPLSLPSMVELTSSKSSGFS